MTNRLRLLLIALVVLAVVLLTACGRDTAPATSTPAAGAVLVSTAVTVEQPTPEPTSTETPRLAAVATPIETPEAMPTAEPTTAPIETPEVAPTAGPTTAPAETPEVAPTAEPTTAPAETPEAAATEEPLLATEVNGTAPQADSVSLSPAEDALTTVDVVKLLRPAVVHIGTETMSMGFFGQAIPNIGVGTGIILDDRGHILTNNHVIASAKEITVTLNTGDSFTAEVVGRDPTTDLAVIRIDAEGLTPAVLGDSSTVEVGEDVIAIGHALGLQGGPTVSKGVVSALGRSIIAGAQATMVDLIQTDASINPGNSGGPLVNDRAEVVGVNTAIIESGQGIGFAININDAKVVARQLVEKGFVERAFLGITPFNLTAALANSYNIPVTEGVIIQQAIPGTGAGNVGLREGDVIVQLGDTPIRNTGELSKFLIEHEAGEKVDLVFYRGMTKITTTVTLGRQPEE